MSTRLQPPTLAGGLISRRRLLDLLHAGRDKRLTYIHAPAGYGKTTLVVQWIQELQDDGVPVAWLSIDHEHDDTVSFLAHLIEAVRRVEPTLGADLGVDLEQRSDQATRYVLGELVNQVAALPAPLAIVLDDWHVITSAETTAALEFLIKSGPENLHLIVTSRTRAPAIGWLRVRDQITEIDVTQLRFERAESAKFLQDLNSLNLDDEDVHRLWFRTDGWVAALQLVKLSLRNSNDPSALIEGFSGRHRSVGDYLTENVLNGLPAELLDFLLTTSVCDRLCAGLATAVSGRPDGQGMLEELERRDLFLRPLDDEREWFRYHHLFADHLRQRLRRDHGDRVVELHRIASAWFAERGLLSEAVTHALAAGDTDTAVDLVEGQAMNLVEHSRMASLLSLVSKLPEPSVITRPVLQMAIAWANCLLQRGARAQTALDHVRAALASTTDGSASVALGEAGVVQAAIDIYADRIDRAAALVAPCLDDMHNYRPFTVAACANIWSFVELHTFAYDEVQARQRWANTHHERAGGPFTGVYGRCFAGMAAFAQLDLATAGQRYTEARELAQKVTGPHSHAARLAGAMQGRLCYEVGEIACAEALLEESRELGAECGVADFMIATYGTLARIKVLRGDIDGALEVLDEGTEGANRLALPRLAAALDHERVRLYLGVDDMTRAGDVLAAQRCHRPESTDGVGMAIRHHRLGMEARILLAHNDFDGASERLSRMRADSVRSGWRYGEALYTVELARAQFLSGDPENASATLAGMLATAAPAGLVRTVVDAGPEVVKIVADLREAGRTGRRAAELPSVPTDYLSRLLAVARSDAETAAIPVIATATHNGASPEEPLTAREIEILRLLDRGLSNKQIARTLGVTINTVKWYLKGTYIKLGVASRGASVSEARRRRILT
ncbi:LuxR C-terminal-related transcriptional regulator [Mycobacterium sp. SMC-4]|uniref:LuxR C-terminal-related transcriptional regulator n=1 Tax=Mycobacterium sp. SMC-4 TaxID=2857059 RepID=UPI003D027F65